ncbi:MAG: zf-HC2 domain-containing protein [Desulfuromonadales bacterium]|nr:zf-HC2 domain-containing protein [Desulfuromonadales bacterium]
MWSCAKNRKHLNAYVDGELPDRARREVEHHLSGCSDCALELDSLRGLAPLLRNEDVPPIPAGLSARILAEAAIRQRRNMVEKTSGRKWPEFLFQLWLVRGATTAALVVGLAMGGWMAWTSQRSSDLEPWMTVANTESAARSIYAFDVLGAEPQGSIEAATLALLANGR